MRRRAIQLGSQCSDLAALALSGELTELEMSVADLSTLIFEIQVRLCALDSFP